MIGVHSIQLLSAARHRDSLGFGAEFAVLHLRGVNAVNVRLEEPNPEANGLSVHPFP